MSYLLNSVDLTTYGIKAGHTSGSNIALAGCFDLPARIGKTYHSWGDDNGVEPYVESDELQFAGRDIIFSGFILGSPHVQRDYINALYTALNALTGLVSFATPYGTFSVYVNSVKERCVVGGCFVELLFREPVVTLTGTIPSIASNANKIDGRAMNSFGLFYESGEGFRSIANMKSASFTKYGAEGYQITKREPENMTFNGFLLATSVTTFIDNIKSLYALFSSSGLRTFILSTNIQVVGFLANGFDVSNVKVYANLVTADFSCKVICSAITTP